MTDSNRVQLAYVPESTWGVTPASPQMRLLRKTSVGVAFEIETIQSEEIRQDRQITDLINVSSQATGTVGFELSFGEYDDLLAAVLFSDWVETPVKHNVTADSSIAGVTNADDTYTVDAGGAAFKAGHLVRMSGFTNSANNGTFKVASSTATTVVVAGTPTLVDEAAPPIGARIKVVGFEGASGDISATSAGLASVSLDFTTLGLAVGQFIQIGGSAAGNKFATAGCNGWARITAVAANLITIDHKPDNWTTDAGSAKNIRVFFGDRLINGSTRKSFSMEEGFLGQATPNYLVYSGMMVSQMTLNIAPGAIVAGTFNFIGYGAAAPSTTPLDATPTESKTGEVLNAISDVARITEGGATVTGPNYIQGMTLEVNNALREQRGVGYFGLVGVGLGRFSVSGDMTTYFGDAATYLRLINSTASSIAIVFKRTNQSYVFGLPRIKLMGGSPTVQGNDQDVPMSSQYQALRDPTVGHTMTIDRLEYVE